MKVNYRGCELDAHRAKSLGGDTLLYYSIFRNDGLEITCGFEDSAEKIITYIGFLKARVDEDIEILDTEITELEQQLAEKRAERTKYTA